MDRDRVETVAGPWMSEVDVLGLYQADQAAAVSPWTTTVDPRCTRADDD